MLNHVLHRAVRHRKSVTANSTELDQELLQHLHSVVNPVPDLFLCIPVQHPVKHHIALVVCLVDCVDKENAEYLCTRIVQECFK